MNTMTRSIFEICDSVAEQIFTQIQEASGSDPITTVKGKVTDHLFSSPSFRRGHISIVDARDTHKLWLLHVTIFPDVKDGCPIYGFDIVAGPNKVSGAFHDFSSGGHTHNVLMRWFADRTKDITWNKKRELPEWAKNIFSDAMVAIGAVGPEELESFCALGLETLRYYLHNVGCTKSYLHDHTADQNFYCEQQRLNPHTPRVLQTLGFTEAEAREFVDQTLFPLT